MGRNRNSHRTSSSRNLRQQGPRGSRPEGQVAGPGDAERRDRRRTLAVCGLLVLAVGLVFGQTVGHEFFNFDDAENVYENRPVASGLSAKGIGWAFDRQKANWHPLTWLSLMADCQFYGLDAGGHHLTNDLLHAATAVLLFLVLRRMTGGFWPSALVAAIFALHPLRVESVAWVTERKDVLSGLFFMLTLAAYVRYVRGPFSLGRYLLVAFVFALGLMAKQSLVTLPFVLLLLDYWPLRRFTVDAYSNPTPPLMPPLTPPHCNGGDFVGNANFLKSSLGQLPLGWQLVLEKLPLFLLAAVSSIVAVWAASEVLMPTERLPLGWRIGNALISYVAYVGQFFYPHGLAPFYPRPGLDLPLWKIGGAFLILLGVTVAVCVWRRRYPYLFVGWLWYLGMLVPVIGLVQVGMGAMADRFTYLPQIGLCMALVWAAADLCHGWRVRYPARAIASASVLAVLMGCAWRQTSFWRDSETLWNHTLACTSRNGVAHNDLGNALANQGRIDEAMAHYQQALEIKPDYVEALNNLGAAFARLGRMNEAITQHQKAVEIKPDYAQAHYNLGVAFARLDRIGEAIAHYQKAVEIKSDYVEAYYNLGNAFSRLDRFDEAIAQYQKALEIQPDYVEAHNNLGYALAARGRIAEAMAHYQKALEIQPDYAEAYYNLGDVLAAQSRIDEAVAHYRHALDLAARHNNQALADASRAKIAQYEAGKSLPQPRPSSMRPPPKP